MGVSRLVRAGGSMRSGKRRRMGNEGKEGGV